MPENHDNRPGADPSTERLRTDSDQRNASDAETTQAWPVQDPQAQGGAPAPESDSERTQQIAALPADFSGFPIGATQTIAAVGSDEPTGYHGAEQTNPGATQMFGGQQGGVGGSQLGWNTSDEPTPADEKRQKLLKGGLIAGAAAAALVLLYVGDLLFTSGSLPRGTVVAGVDVGTLDPAAAESRLRDELEPGLSKPVRLQVGDRGATVKPDEVGLQMDWAETVKKADDQPLNPFTRIGSLFSTHDVTPVSRSDREQLVAALQEVSPQLGLEPTDGNIRFEGTTPIPVNPVPGQNLDIQHAADAVQAEWAEGRPISLPVTQLPVSTTREGVQKALHEIAEPAVASPVTVRGQGKNATLAPEVIAEALRFTPDGHGGLKASLDGPALVGAIEPQLRDTMKPGKNAEIKLESGAPVVHPSEDGVGVDWEKSLAPLLDTLRKPQQRAIQAVYVPAPAQFTTDQANQLGIREVVGEFQTGGFEPASGVNIRRVAEQVNGAVLRPGETFSLNGYTGPRGVPQGYVESGIIEDGHPGKAVGGGISQFATTLYNASYFAGMKDVEHKAHSYYISRYPAGREATVFQSPNGKSIIDVKFKNVSKSGIMITTEWTPSSIKVKLWGTKQFDVQSSTGPRTEPTPPTEKPGPATGPCSPSKGAPGFTVVDTRTIRDITTGEVRTENQKVKYNPQPIIHCPPPPPPPR
ncbi:vanomycin resistance protein VanB [Saccharopolyspora karakumensis]|uniref:Vanomycin resistance protein VanB n=1 Tax=Saccharopolyspora karakumensis TaxID=2530386 RepID=A0A4R5BMX9_9PSEU|nr:VanW family protein [Saccharopolyspora karakumensis]TDD85302.1 vanomycin resistance protein VanB [Saccharopolyspora karakumensis]